MKFSEKFDVIFSAIAKSQSEMEPAKAEMVNPMFRSKYANLSAYLAALKPLHANGIAMMHDVQMVEGGVEVTMWLIHGQSQQYVASAPTFMPVGKNDAHGWAGAVTYAKKVNIQAFLGLSAAEDDDDGNSAVKNRPEEDPEVVGALEGATSLSLLQDVWKSLSEEQRRAHVASKERVKKQLSGAK